MNTGIEVLKRMSFEVKVPEIKDCMFWEDDVSVCERSACLKRPVLASLARQTKSIITVEVRDTEPAMENSK